MPYGCSMSGGSSRSFPSLLGRSELSVAQLMAIGAESFPTSYFIDVLKLDSISRAN